MKIFCVLSTLTLKSDPTESYAKNENNDFLTIG